MHKNGEEEVNHPPFTAFSQHHNQQAEFMVHQPFENIYSSYSNLRRMQSSSPSQSTLQLSQTMTSKTNDSSEGSNSSSSSTIMALSSSSSSIHDAPPTATSSQSNTSGNNNMWGLIEGRAFR